MSRKAEEEGILYAFRLTTTTRGGKRTANEGGFLCVRSGTAQNRKGINLSKERGDEAGLIRFQWICKSFLKKR